MRNVDCLICRESIGGVDLRGSTGADVHLLEATELGQARRVGVEHLRTQHPEITALRVARDLPLDPLIRIGRYNPADGQSDIQPVSFVRRRP